MNFNKTKALVLAAIFLGVTSNGYCSDSKPSSSTVEKAKNAVKSAKNNACVARHSPTNSIRFMKKGTTIDTLLAEKHITAVQYSKIVQCMEGTK